MSLEQVDEYNIEIDVLESATENLPDNYDPPFSWKSRIFREEIKKNLKMAFPVSITNLMQYMLTVETMSFCGRLSSLDLESVGLALSMMNVLGWCICNGMVTACDTMFAQTFGSDEKKRMGLLLQRGLLIINFVPILLITVYFNSEPLLILLGQNVDISRTTGEFLIIFSPGLIFMANYLIFARYMQDQGCLWPPVVAGFCGNIFNIATQLIFVTYLGYGLRAAALSHAFSYGIMLACELIFILKTRFYVPTWLGFQIEAFYDWSQMVKLGLAGVVNFAFEVIVWEGNIFIGGIIGPKELATQSIIIQIISVPYAIYNGFGIATNIRVGQCLGAKKPNQAKTAYRAGVAAAGLVVLIMGTLIISLQKQIPYIFTDKEEVINMVVEVFPSIYVIFLTEPFVTVYNASLRGCGRQAIGSLIIFVAFYIVGIPCCLILAFVFELGIKGLWIGTSVAEAFTLSLAFILVECQNWKKQALLAEQRILYSSLKPMNEGKTTEAQSLLHPLLMEDDILHRYNGHIRTPSYPVTCSTNIVKIPPPRKFVHKSIIYKKSLLVFTVIFILICGVLLHFLLPSELYRRNSSLLV